MAWVVYIYSLIVITIGVIYKDYNSLWFYVLLVVLCNIRILKSNNLLSIKKIQGELDEIKDSLIDKQIKRDQKCIQH